MKAKTIQDLYADFEKIDERDGLGGKKFKYLKPAPVIHRLNKVFNNRWSMRVLEYISLDDWVVVKVELTVPDEDWDHVEGGQWVVREAYGSKEIEKYGSGPKKGKAIDPGNAFKSATSDALKKAASTLGIGLHQLYELDENGSQFVDNSENDPVSAVLAAIEVEDPKPVHTEESKPFDESAAAIPVPDPSATTPVEDGQELITEVQKTAVEKMSGLKNTPINTLIESALGEIRPLEKLTYQEGILVIREANKIKTPTK
jgi:hypothetical protein